MRRLAGRALAGVAGCALALAAAHAQPPASSGASEPQVGRPTLRVVTYNTWHGRRTEGKFKLPGESKERQGRRYAAQLEALRELEPDLLILQEVNPSARRTRALARGLGLTEIHKVTSCGLHLGFLLKIPININEGQAILARPELGLTRLGHRLLSGKHRCWGDHLGFQTSETRYALLGAISVGGRRLLVASTHLHAPPTVPDDFAERLADLVAEGALAAEQRQAILDELAGHRNRTRGEAELLAGELAALGKGYDGVVLGGDLNAEAGSDVVGAFLEAGFRDPLAGREAELVTFDPVANAENYEFGRRQSPQLETFDVPQVVSLLMARSEKPRRIDWILVAGALEPAGGGVVLDEERDGLLPSDHFGLAAGLEPR